MISDQLEINNECLLLEHAETLVKLLNRFGKKTNVSSQHILDKLRYLYFRLFDFLAQEGDIEGNNSRSEVSFTESSIQKSTLDSKLFDVDNESCSVSHHLIPPTKQDYESSLVQHIQEVGKNYNSSINKPTDHLLDAMSKIQLEKQDIDVNQGIKRKDSAAIKNTSGITLSTIRCGICKELIPIIDSNFTLAMELHTKEEIHRSAVELEITIQEVTNISPVTSEKEIAVYLDPYISYDDVSKYFCELCKKYISGIDNAKQHIIGSAHKSKLAVKDIDADITMLENGMYFCNLCFAPLGNSSNAIFHIKGKNHSKKVIVKQNMGHVFVTEERVWSKIPSSAKKHRIYFENEGDSIVYCKLCATNVPKTVVNILSHINGKQHFRAFNNKVLHVKDV